MKMQILTQNILMLTPQPMGQEKEIRKFEVFHWGREKLEKWEVEHGKKIDKEILKLTCNKCSRSFLESFSEFADPIKFVATHSGKIVWWHSFCIKFKIKNHDSNTSKTKNRNTR